MAKSKRKIYKPQRDKAAIAVAAKLKKEGILSKQVKLHGGKYISKEVLAKVREYQHLARLNYTAVKVNKKIARAAKERGFQTVMGNKVIGPKTQTFRNRIKSGKLTGIKPVKGGYMEEVILPHTIYDLRTLVEQLEDGGIETLKLPHEQFAFKYKGAESYRAFLDSKQLLDYLTHYKGINAAISSSKPEDLTEEFENLVIFRLHPQDTTRVIPGPKARQERKIRERAEAIKRGEYVIRRKKKPGKSWKEKLEGIAAWRAEKMREAKAKSAQAYRDRMTPAQKEAAKAAAKARYHAKKGKGK